LGVDSGDGNFTAIVYRWAIMAGPNVYPMKGKSSPLRDGAMQQRAAVKGKESRKLDHRGKLILVCPVEVNDRIDALMTSDLSGRPGDGFAMTFADEAQRDSELHRQLTSWERIDGRWVSKEGRDADHYWDARRYAVALAAKAGVFRGDGSEWRAPRHAPRVAAAAPARQHPRNRTR
jgi:hypothetical protein